MDTDGCPPTESGNAEGDMFWMNTSGRETTPEPRQYGAGNGT